MTDCPNAEMRDRLPDLLHERLDAPARAAVVAHVDGCAECRAELELLRQSRAVLDARAPRMDVAYIVNALPAPARRASRDVIRLSPRRSRWADWRIAAAVTVLVAGGSSVALLNRASPATPAAPAATSMPNSTSTASTARGAAGAAAPTTASAAASAASAASAGSTARRPTEAPSERNVVASASEDEAASADLGNGARLSDLTPDQLQQLLHDVQHLQAVPVTDPDPTGLRVTPMGSAGQ